MPVKPIRLTEEASHRMAVANFICACLVVLIHCTPNIMQSGSWQWWVINLLGADGLCRIAVPWFFIASGCFLAGKFDREGWYCEAIKKRVRSLLLPFVVWSLIGLLFFWCMWYGIQMAGYSCDVRNPVENGVCHALVSALGFDPSHLNIGVIWYLRMLFLFVLISPAIYLAVKKIGLLAPIAFFVIYGIYDSTVHFDEFWEYVFSVRGLAYFTVGIVIRLGYHNRFARNIKNRSSYFCLALGGVILLIVNTYARLRGMVALARTADFLMVPPLLCAVWLLTAQIRLPRACTSNSFAVYVMHGFFIHVSIALMILLGFRAYVGNPMLIFVARTFFAVLFSILFANVLKRAVPMVASVLFGGR